MYEPEEVIFFFLLFSSHSYLASHFMRAYMNLISFSLTLFHPIPSLISFACIFLLQLASTCKVASANVYVAM